MASRTGPKIFIESRSILTANYLHFFALAFAFFFPLWFSLISLPSVLKTLILSNAFHNSYIIVLALIYTLLAFSLSVSGIATITYSTHAAYNRRPLSLSTTIKSLSVSFFPLASTTLTFLVCMLLICTVPLLCASLLIYTIKIHGFGFDQSSYFFFLGCVLASIIVLLLLVFCKVICVVASVVAVLETKWGFEPLRQSYYLIKETRSDDLCFLFQHGILNFFIVTGFSYPILFFPHSKWSYLAYMQVGITSFFEAWLILQFAAACTVLYLNSKRLNGELSVQSDDEISDEYTRLATEENKVSDESRVESGSDWSGLIQLCFVLVIIVFFLHMIWFNRRYISIAELFKIIISLGFLLSLC